MKGPERILYWSPRILGTLAVLFISLFALDAFEAGRPLHEQLLHFLIHLIPSFILLSMLVIACYRALWGGIILALISLVISPFIFMGNYKINNSIPISLGILLMITFPFFVVGILFILSYFQKGRS